MYRSDSVFVRAGEIMNSIDRMKASVRIRVEGDAKERFLNMCRARNFPVWDIQADKEQNIICMSMNKRHFLASKSAIRKTGVKVAVTEKSGLPFLLKKISARRVFAAGAIFCILFLILMMQSVWAFEFEGNLQITNEQITDYLESRGVIIGTPVRKLDYGDLEAGLREQFDEITWASVVRRGTTLIIRIKEREYAEVSQRYTDRTDIVADVSGTIVSMVVKEGVPLVKTGSQIEQGDILVCGAVPIYDADGGICGYHYYHAQADILVETARQFHESLSLSYNRKKYTGEKRVQLSLGAFDRNLTIGASMKDEEYESHTDSYQLCLFRYLHLPFFAKIVRQYSYEWERAVYTKEEAEAILLSDLQKYLSELSEKGVQIIAKDVRIIKSGMNMQITADLTLQEWIGVSQPTTVGLLQDGEDYD